MTRLLCIVFWTIVANELAFLWKDYLLGVSNSVVQTLRRMLPPGMIDAAFVIELFNASCEAMPWIVAGCVFSIGLMGLLPGTRRASEISCKADGKVEDHRP